MGRVGELAEGERSIVTVRGRSIGIFNDGGQYFALHNRCPHHGAPLCEGAVSGMMRQSAPQTYEYSGDTPDERVVRCPWHGFGYRLSDGASVTSHGTKVRAYRVRVEDDEIVLYV